jgi:hypothetical protein
MDQAYDLIRNSDFIALALVAGLLFYIGQAIGSGRPRVMHTGACLGGIAFLAFCIAAVMREGYQPIEMVAGYILQGVMAAGIVAGTFWTAASIIYSSGDTVSPIPRYIKRKRDSARYRAQAEAQRRIDEANRQHREELDRKERELARLHLEERQKVEAEAARRHVIEQQRRTEARAQCELLYSLHAKEIADRYPKPRLNSFMQTYMNDSHPAEMVERRGQEIRNLIEQHRSAVVPPKKCHTIQELAEWLVTEQRRIDLLPLDEELREEHRVLLNIRYAELTQNMLQKMEP